MKRSDLNLVIGHTMSALKQAKRQQLPEHAINFIRNALRLLCKARTYLKQGKIDFARYWISCALSDIRFAKVARHCRIVSA